MSRGPSFSNGCSNPNGCNGNSGSAGPSSRIITGERLGGEHWWYLA